MAWFPTIILIIFVSGKGRPEKIYCDEDICDFGLCDFGNECRYNEYICTEKASQCLLSCNSCRDVTIRSSSQHTEVTCNAQRSCNNLQIFIEEPLHDLRLECKGPQISCLRVNIQSNPLSTVNCQDYDQYQCSNNVNIEWLASKTTTKPSLNPTSKPTLTPTSKPTIASTSAQAPKTSSIATPKPSLNPTQKSTVNPTTQTLLAVVDKPTMKPTLKAITAQISTIDRIPETLVVTKTIFIFAKQTNSQLMPLWSKLFILFTVFCGAICIGMMIFIKMTRKRDAIPLQTQDGQLTDDGKERISDSESEDDDGEINEGPGTISFQGSPSSDIYKPRTSEGDLKFNIYPTEAVECVVLDNSYDDLYEGNRIFTKGNEYEVIQDECYHANIVVTEIDSPLDEPVDTIVLDYEDPSLPEDMMGVGSLSSMGSDMLLLYGPGSGNQTSGK